MSWRNPISSPLSFRRRSACRDSKDACRQTSSQLPRRTRPRRDCPPTSSSTQPSGADSNAGRSPQARQESARHGPTFGTRLQTSLVLLERKQHLLRLTPLGASEHCLRLRTGRSAAFRPFHRSGAHSSIVSSLPARTLKRPEGRAPVAVRGCARAPDGRIFFLAFTRPGAYLCPTVDGDGSVYTT